MRQHHLVSLMLVVVLTLGLVACKTTSPAAGGRLLYRRDNACLTGKILRTSVMDGTVVGSAAQVQRCEADCKAYSDCAGWMLTQVPEMGFAKCELMSLVTGWDLSPDARRCISGVKDGLPKDDTTP
jgi:hypothetical protein